MIRTLAFAAAALCAALMGFAIQRGATCTVAAVEEVVLQRKAARLLALGEASLWVCAGLLVAHWLQVAMPWPAGHALTSRTLAGAVLLGMGAFVNQACVFGAIARFGSGEWVYALTTVGFYAGSLLAVRHAALDPSMAAGPPGAFMTPWAPAVLAGLLAWRLTSTCLRRPAPGRAGIASRVWSPHAATTLIGIAFLAMFLLVGAWAYTDALADLARGSSQGLAGRALLAIGLLAGATWGGWTAGRFRSRRVQVDAVARCLAGGALMGWGSLLIPGSNDGLILVGLPMLWPHAWAAFLTMCVSIGLAIHAQARVRAWRGTQSASPPRL